MSDHILDCFSYVHFPHRRNRLDENEIEGEEDGDARVDSDEEVKITPFNMKEELQEGHFDGDGHYQWNKEKDITDNWLDNIDWVKIKKDSNYKQKYNAAGLPDSEAESSTDEEEDAKAKAFNLVATYKNIHGLMKPKETVKKTLQRLGGNKKLTTAQRWKLKKQGLVDENAELVTKMTGYCDEILTRTGNMNVYEETFETIAQKIKDLELKQARSNPNIVKDDDLDMYADDFDTKEQEKLVTTEPGTSQGASTSKVENEDTKDDDVQMWEYKVTLEDEKILGPFTSEQMQKFVDDGKFKEPVFVRKIEEGSNDKPFYTSARIDFELYI